jgi:diaminopimelate epimerase
MKIHFHKYEGAGNDFIIIDNRAAEIKFTSAEIEKLCDRRFGIGADGLMLLESCTGADFNMVYFNADGNESSFCGNGGRCIADYAFHVLKIVGKQTSFLASDGLHQATIHTDGTISLTMRPVNEINFFDDHVELNTGSPHLVQFVNNLEAYPVFEEGRRIRNLPMFQPKGINVNFLEIKDGKHYLRTYERGVEDETYACGTGITAAAVALAGKEKGHFQIELIAKAGHFFVVEFNKSSDSSAENILLKGPVNMVFEGLIENK